MYKSLSAIFISLLFASCAFADSNSNEIGEIIYVHHFNASNPDENVKPVAAVELWIKFKNVPEENLDFVNIKGPDTTVIDVNILDTGFVEGQHVTVKRVDNKVIVQKV